jgi:hypothetical protein
MYLYHVLFTFINICGIDCQKKGYGRMKTSFGWIESVRTTTTDHTCSNIIGRDDPNPIYL